MGEGALAPLVVVVAVTALVVVGCFVVLLFRASGEEPRPAPALVG